MKQSFQNTQEVFLKSVKKSKDPLTIFLVNGIKLRGVISSFDSFSILLQHEGNSQLVYKHAISTIMPSPNQSKESFDALISHEDELNLE